MTTDLHVPNPREGGVSIAHQALLDGPYLDQGDRAAAHPDRG